MKIDEHKIYVSLVSNDDECKSISIYHLFMFIYSQSIQA